ncbi:MAG: YbjN domain-containing protein [Brevundimonas sp.]|uniref:YbjN domain-containing protein n=1 Tax=Brevundimonas sp. TaxID=1871086 RepID=UPI0025C507E3|nr:YbjN domain-containing protein [Brevundimonas sp.]MBX3477950.1 YbjN domain-containing protein [Brevundimonas sp.]
MIRFPRLTPFAPALSAALVLGLAPASLAQDTSSRAAPPAEQAQDQAPLAGEALMAAPGVTLAEAGAWLATAGATVGEPQTAGGRTYIPVSDGALSWTLWLYACPRDVCDDIQFSAIFSGAGITQEKVNDWNRDHRFLKAFFAPAQGDTPPRAAVQYDVVLTAPGMVHLSEPAGIWVDLLGQFARAMGLDPNAASVPDAAPAAED